MIFYPPPVSNVIQYDGDIKLLLRGADHYSFLDIPMKVILISCAFVLSMSLFNIIPEVKFLSIIGRDSLFYYLWHAPIVKFILPLLCTKLHLPKSFIWMIVYTLVVILLLWVMSHSKLFRWFVLPIKK